MQRSNSSDLFRETLPASIALLALTLICALAFVPSTSLISDRVALFAIGLGCIAFSWTPLAKHILETPERAMFLLCAAMFVVYGLARSAGPETGFSLHFAALPDDEFVVPYSANIVIFGAIFSARYWWLQTSNWARSLLGAGVVMGFFTLLSFWILKRHFPVGPFEILEPTPLPRMAMSIVEYCSLALCCHAVTSHKVTRQIALRMLPGVLLALWARHQFSAAPEDSE